MPRRKADLQARPPRRLPAAGRPACSRARTKAPDVNTRRCLIRLGRCLLSSKHWAKFQGKLIAQFPRLEEFATPAAVSGKRPRDFVNKLRKAEEEFCLQLLYSTHINEELMRKARTRNQEFHVMAEILRSFWGHPVTVDLARTYFSYRQTDLCYTVSDEFKMINKSKGLRWPPAACSQPGEGAACDTWHYEGMVCWPDVKCYYDSLVKLQDLPPEAKPLCTSGAFLPEVEMGGQHALKTERCTDWAVGPIEPIAPEAEADELCLLNNFSVGSSCYSGDAYLLASTEELPIGIAAGGSSEFRTAGSDQPSHPSASRQEPFASPNGCQSSASGFWSATASSVDSSCLNSDHLSIILEFCTML